MPDRIFRAASTSVSHTDAADPAVQEDLVGGMARFIGMLVGYPIGAAIEGIKWGLNATGATSTLESGARTLGKAAASGAAEGAIDEAKERVSTVASALLFKPDDAKEIKSATTTSTDASSEPDDDLEEDASLPELSLHSIFSSILSGNIDPRIGVDIIGQFFKWARENIGNDQVFRSTDSKTLDRLGGALDACISLIGKYGNKKISLQHCIGEIRNKLGDFHPLLLGILEISSIGKSPETQDPLSMEQTKDLDVLDRHAGLEGKKTFNDLRERTKIEQKRFVENVTLFSTFQFVHYMLGHQKSSAEIDIDIRTQLDAEDVDQDSDEWETRYAELKRDRQVSLGGKDSCFSSFMQRLEDSDINEEDRKEKFKEYLSDYISGCTNINFFKRLFINISLPIVMWACEFFSEKMIGGLVTWIKKKVTEAQSNPAKALNPLPFESGINATDEMIRAYESFKDGKPLKSGKNPGAPTQYLKGKLDEDKFDYSQLTSQIVSQSLPGLELTAPISRAIKAMENWASRDKGIPATIFCYSLAILPISLLWIVNTIFVYPFDLLVNFILRNTTIMVLDSNHIIESIVKHDNTALEASEFACAIEEVVALWVEQVYETIRSQRAENYDQLEGLDPNQKDEITKAINGFLLNLFKVSDLSALPNRDKVKDLLESDDNIIAALSKLPESTLDKLRIPRIMDSLVEVLIVLMKEAYTQKSSELYLGKILEAANRSIVNSDRVDSSDALRERQEDVRRTRMHYQDMIVRLSIENSVSKTIRDLGVVHQEASQNYIDWLKDNLLGDLDKDDGTRSGGKISEWEKLLTNLLKQDNPTQLTTINTICDDVTKVYKEWRRHQERMEMDPQMATSAKSPAIAAMRTRFRAFIDQLVTLQNTIMYKQMDAGVLDQLKAVQTNIHLIKTSTQPSSPIKRTTVTEEDTEPVEPDGEVDAPISMDTLKAALRATKTTCKNLQALADHFPKALNRFIVDLHDTYIPKMQGILDKLKIVDTYEKALNLIEGKAITSYAQIRGILTSLKMDHIIPILDKHISGKTTYADLDDPITPRVKDAFKELVAEAKKAAAKATHGLEIGGMDDFIEELQTTYDEAKELDDEAMEALKGRCLITLDADDEIDAKPPIERSLIEEVEKLDPSHYETVGSSRTSNPIKWIQELLLGVDDIDDDDDDELHLGKIAVWTGKLEDAIKSDAEEPESIVDSVLEDAHAIYEQFSKDQAKIAKNGVINEKDKEAVSNVKKQFKAFIERVTALYDVIASQQFQDSINEPIIVIQESTRILDAFIHHKRKQDVIDDGGTPLLLDEDTPLDLDQAVASLRLINGAVQRLKEIGCPLPTKVKRLIQEVENKYTPSIKRILDDMKKVANCEAALAELSETGVTYADVATILKDHGLEPLTSDIDTFVRSKHTHSDKADCLLERTKDVLQRIIKDEKLRIHQSIPSVGLDALSKTVNETLDFIISSNSVDMDALKDECLQPLTKANEDDDDGEKIEPSLAAHVKSLRPVDYVDVHLIDTSGFIRFINRFFYTATKQKINSIISALQQPVIVGKLAEEILLRPILE